MSNICCVLQLARDLVSYVKDQQAVGVAIHWLVYIAQKVFNVHLGYRFKWGVKGPYSRGLARDLKAGNVRERCICDENLRLPSIREFLEDLRSTGIRLDKALEIAASYIMLRYDVYPKPPDPLEELLKKKPYITLREAQVIARVLNKYLVGLRERA
ncbi:MAG: hypothetical protein J7L51_03845 [Desulfurococcales archaeon]|nr:hypothetical protein [Desulfurococcales archaeon]